MKRNLKEDYLTGAAELRPFYQHNFQHPDFETLMVEKAKAPIDRKGLRSELERQYAGLSLTPKVTENLRKIGEEGTFTVTTGHQLCLLTGPMFSVYKILTIIRLAEDLQKKYPERALVPVFWMASEDHDAAEIDHYYSGFEQKVRYAAPIQGPVGRHVLTEAIREVIPAPYQDFYQPGRTLAEAHRHLVHHLFGKFGLIIIDGDSPILKRQFQTQMVAELTDKPSGQLVSETSEKLKDLGYPAQVFPRELNLFYLSPGRRDRLVWEVRQYDALGSGLSFSQESLLQELKESPENFSPNVILRPLYQEVILPNIAYAGGWGELSYWMQLKTMFAHFGVAFPLLVPRMNASLIPEDHLESWENLGFSPEDFGKELHVLFDQYLPKLWDKRELMALREAFNPPFSALGKYVSAIEPTMTRSIEAERTKTMNYLEKLEKKLAKSVRNQNPKPFQQIQSIKEAVQPGNTPQERVLNITSYSQPPEAIIDLLYEKCKPLDPSHLWIPLP